MENREAEMSNGRSIIVLAVIASALSWSLPAAADDAAVNRLDLRHLGLVGRTLSDAEMSDMRGGYVPGSTVTIQVGDVVTTDSDPNTPGSASVTVNLGPGTVSKGFASTSGTGASSARSSTVISGSVITNTASLNAGASLRIRHTR
jgi:hypothetical protein